MNPLVLKAKKIATRAHSGQFRKDGVTPYIVHPAEVARCVAPDEKAQAAAWLHDVLEDTPTKEADLRKAGIPEDVIAAVKALTKMDPKGDMGSYEKYILGIKANPLASKVKIADMLSNLAGDPSEAQKKRYALGLNILGHKK